MQITNFTLPATKLCVVVWYRNGKRSENLIPTPASNAALTNVMLANKEGRSEIRAIKPVHPGHLIGSRV